MTLRLPRFGRAFLSILLIGNVLFQALPQAATGTIMPSPYQTVFDTNGNPVSGAKICTFLAGTTTNTATYTDSALLVPNSNPIVADSAGRFTAYLSPGASYKFTYQDSTGTPGTCNGVTIKTVDNISAVPANSGNVDVVGTAGEAISAGQAVYLSDGSGAKTAGQWFKADSANTYSSTQPEVGIAIAAIASGSTGTIRISGLVPGLSSLTIGAAYYIGTGGALTSTAPANQRLMGVADTTTSLVEVPAAARAQSAPGTSTITTTGTQTALAIPGGSGNLVIFSNNATLLTVQGITAGIDGQRLTIYSIGAGQVDFVHQSGSASAALRLLNNATIGNTSLAPASGATAGVAEYVYDLTIARWRLTNHDQGAWITPTFAAGNFTGSGSMTWTVASAGLCKYWLRGRTLTVAISVTATTVGGTPSTILQIGNGAWGGYSASSASFYNLLVTANDSPTAVGARLGVTAATTLGAIKTSGAVWTAGATTDLLGQVTFEIT